MTDPRPERYPLLFSLFALLLGAGCGVLHVMVEAMDQPDPLLSALAVTMCSMLLGLLRPAQPWRWALLVGIPVPMAVAIAAMVIPTEHFTRATIGGSFLVWLPGCAGAFGGSILRRKLGDLFFDKKDGNS